MFGSLYNMDESTSTYFTVLHMHWRTEHVSMTFETDTQRPPPPPQRQMVLFYHNFKMARKQKEAGCGRGGSGVLYISNEWSFQILTSGIVLGS